MLASLFFPASLFFQDMSIDVYGRGEKKARDEAMAKAAAEEEEAKKAKQDQEEQDLDALLAA
jgi:hypothetical protein